MFRIVNEKELTDQSRLSDVIVKLNEDSDLCSTL